MGPQVNPKIIEILNISVKAEQFKKYYKLQGDSVDMDSNSALLDQRVPVCLTWQ